jgi:iron(III) transport system ATP-binding protein
MSALSLSGVGKRYGSVIALESIDLDVGRGSRTVVVGASGSGKTTLLRLIAGFDVPTIGTIVVDGEIVANHWAAVPAHKRRIGVVLQDGALFPHLDVFDNIGFGLGRGEPERARRILSMMEVVELAPGLRSRRPHELSGGQQQRVALARALVRKPSLILLDEPFSALDAGLREATRKAVGDILRDQGVTTILVTHDQAEALSFADQVAVLREGRLVQAGPPGEVYYRPRDAETAMFMGEAIILPAEAKGLAAQCALGTVALDSERIGTCRIMLRPEQLRLEPDTGAQEETAAVARILAVEFGGATSLLSLRVDKRGEDRAELRLRAPSIGLPEVGTCRRLVVSGEAHVFAE